MANLVRLTVDPSLESMPDFDSVEFRAIFAAGATVENPVDLIVTRLRGAWTAENDARKVRWQAQAERDKAKAETEWSARRDEARKDRELEQLEREKKRPKLKTLKIGLMVDTFPTIRPSAYALHKLRQYEYIELYYFTTEACSEAEMTDQSATSEAYILTKVGEELIVKPMTLLKPSKRVIPDERLDWKQMIMAKQRLLTYMEQEQWPNDLIMNLSMFFVNLDTHVLRSRPGGDSVLLRYQAHVRRDWFEAVKESSNGPLFDIAIIQEERLRDMYRTYTNTSQLDSIAQLQAHLKAITSLTPQHVGKSSQNRDKRRRSASPSKHRSRGRARR